MPRSPATRATSQLARRFSHRALLDPLARGDDTLDGLHSNTQIPKVDRLQPHLRSLRRSGRDYDRAAQFFWETVVERRSFATGGHGDVEHFFPHSEFAKHLGSAKTMETCCTHNMLRLTRSLFARDPLASYIDYFERALFNGILASQDPETRHEDLLPVDAARLRAALSHAVRFVLVLHGFGHREPRALRRNDLRAQRRDTLYVNLFIASTLDWRERGITLTQSTRFPDADTTRLDVHGRETTDSEARDPPPGVVRGDDDHA